MSDFDTLRWGDSATLDFFKPGQPATAQTTKQLVHAYWRRPLTWKLLVVARPQLPSTEGGTFHPVVNVTIGIGQSISDTIPLVLTVAPVAGVYSPVVQFFDIPAQDIQVNVSLDAGAGATQETDPEYWQFSAFAAPFTEPYGYTVVGDHLLGPEGGQHQTRRMPDQWQEPRWMPPGFDDGEIRYRR